MDTGHLPTDCQFEIRFKLHIHSSTRSDYTPGSARYTINISAAACDIAMCSYIEAKSVYSAIKDPVRLAFTIWHPIYTDKLVADSSVSMKQIMWSVPVSLQSVFSTRSHLIFDYSVPHTLLGLTNAQMCNGW